MPPGVTHCWPVVGWSIWKRRGVKGLEGKSHLNATVPCPVAHLRIQAAELVGRANIYTRSSRWTQLTDTD